MTSAVVHPAGTYENHGEMYTVPYEVKISQYTLASIILDAIEAGHSGIMYWCPKVRLGQIAVEQYEGEHHHEYLGRNLTHGGTVVFFVPDDEDVVVDFDTDNVTQKGVTMHHLTRDKLLNGVAQAVKNGNIKLRGVEDDGSADFDLDGPACDVILQYALFGEVVYG
jgi:hypothetical protein